MEWPAQSPNLNPIENLWGDIKNVVFEAKPRNSQELWNVVHPGLKYLFLGVRSWLTQCNADVQQLSKTMVMQLHISSVI